MKLQAGDILLHKGERWTSRIIRWFTKSPYTHVGIVFDEDKILEIDITKRLAIYPLDKEIAYDVYRYKEGLNEQKKKELKAKMIQRKTMHKGYDWIKLFSLGFSSLIKKPVFLDAKNRVICSEIVDYIYNDIGIDLVPNTIIGHVTPSDIASSPHIEKAGTINE